MHSDGYPGYEANCPYGCSGVCPNSNVTLRLRDPSAGLLTEAVWKVYQVDVTPAQLVYTQTATGAQANTSTLRFKAGLVVGARYEVQLLERNACSVGPPNTYSLEVINCARGDEPFFTAPGQPATEAVAAYPNPADNDLTLEQGGGTVRLSDAYGKPVHSQASQPGRLHLDTSHLPAGLYFLEMRSAKGQPVPKQIHVRH